MRAVFLLAAAASISACAFQEARDYRIVNADSRDSAKLTRILRQVAAETGLPQAGAPGDKMPGFYRSDKVMLNAIRRGSDIEIELSRLDSPAPHAYTRAEALLTSGLSQAFGRKLTILPPHPVERVMVTE
jgi:hypothetical protein